MLALLRRDQDSVVGHQLVDLAPDGVAAAHLADILDRSHQGVWRGEFPLLDSAGDLIHLQWSLSAHLEPGVSMAIAMDISERVVLSQQREQLLEREQAARSAAERLSRSKDEFIAVLSHELRTPLNAIMGWVHVLQTLGRPGRADARRRSDRTQCEYPEAAHLRHPRRVAHGPGQAASGSGIGECGGIGGIRGQRARGRRCATSPCEVCVDVPACGIPIIADAARLQQIAWNLLTNAVKFSQPGGRVWVRLSEGATDFSSRRGRRGPRLQAGFSSLAVRPVRTERLRQQRYHGGLGLGLSIVKHLVEMHEGSVDAESRGVGLGARFTVTLPIRRAPVAHDAGSLCRPRATDPTPTPRPTAWTASASWRSRTMPKRSKCCA